MRLDVERKYMWMDASYTVEGAAVISICFLLTMSAILLGYDIFREAFEFVSETKDELNVVRIFKTKQTIADIAGKIFGK